MSRQSGGQPRRRNSRSRLPVLLVAGAVILVVIALGSRTIGGASDKGSSVSSSTPQPTQAANQPPGSPTPLVAPTPVIALPKACPANTIPQVDNPGRYGFCVPSGWGAWNNNNGLALTQVIKARQGDSPILQPTDFDRIQVVVNLNTSSPGDSAPADCRGDPNDRIGTFPVHHCSAQLDPSTNPYHAIRADFWVVDLAQDNRFYMTALYGADTTPDDDAVVEMVVHSLVPPGSE